jgi:hypothetical protein
MKTTHVVSRRAESMDQAPWQFHKHSKNPAVDFYSGSRCFPRQRSDSCPVTLTMFKRGIQLLGLVLQNVIVFLSSCNRILCPSINLYFELLHRNSPRLLTCLPVEKGAHLVTDETSLRSPNIFFGYDSINHTVSTSTSTKG